VFIILYLLQPVAKVYLQKNPDFIGFFKTKPRHPDGLKQIWVEKLSNGSPAPNLATAFRYLIYKHRTFLRHKVIRSLPNVTVAYSVLQMMIIVKNDTLQTFRQGFNKLKSRTKITNETEEKTC